ncbi:MAG: hypothetical protein V2J25_16685 [Desulfatiglans sp.]|jgi:hypothetical protein|nr:hypothetical protein [Thermodesulfobacteriota bacterium]MEE4354498.1 hypothetical protein [Desulfatiglans sp.]
MKEVLHRVLDVEDVKGVMFFSLEGELLFREFLSPLSEEPEKKDWWDLFIYSLNRVKEADLIYEKNRIYIRRTEIGFLLVLMGLYTPMAMLRLDCDMLLPTLKKKKGREGLRGLFRAKK